MSAMVSRNPRAVLVAADEGLASGAGAGGGWKPEVRSGIREFGSVILLLGIEG